MIILFKSNDCRLTRAQQDSTVRKLFHYPKAIEAGQYAPVSYIHVA